VEERAMTITIHGQRTIDAGTTLTLGGPFGIYLSQQNVHKAPQLFNFGVIDVTSDSGENALVGIESDTYSGPGSVFWNETGGVYKVSATYAGGGYAYGFMIEQGGCVIRNDGEFDVSSTGGAIGVSAGGRDFDFTNAGDFTVTAAAEATGVGGSSNFDNSGLFDVEAGTGPALGVFGSATADPQVNSGSMRVIDHDGLMDGGAVNFYPQFGPASFINSGSIIASDYAFKEVSGTLSSGDARQYIFNSGSVVGTTDLGAADDEFHNTGKVRGDIYLRSGNDVYDGGGKLAGSLYGGSGDDTLIGGKGADHIFGDNAAPVPSDGADVINGGAGADVLSGGGGADDFVFSTVKDTRVDRPDLITDLDASDTIDLSLIDADKTTKGDQAFHLTVALDGHAGEAALVYDAAAGETRLELDIDGDGAADATILLSGDHRDFTDFIL
jgi:Ca2+-binding RTX toxin-like protein